MVPQSRCKISPIGKGEKKEKQKNRAQIYRLVCTICDIPARESRCSLEETKCRPTSAAATRNFVTSLPSCNDALSWISTRFPPVSDRLSIRGEWERRRREREHKLPLSTSLSHLHLSLAEVEEKNWVSTRSAGRTRTICTRKPFYGGGTMTVTGSRTKAREHIEKWKK